jgi:hypothetical protein
MSPHQERRSIAESNAIVHFFLPILLLVLPFQAADPAMRDAQIGPDRYTAWFSLSERVQLGALTLTGSSYRRRIRRDGADGLRGS